MQDERTPPIFKKKNSNLIGLNIACCCVGNLPSDRSKGQFSNICVLKRETQSPARIERVWTKKAKHLYYKILYFIINYNEGDIVVQAIVKIGEYEDRILTIVKGKFGLKNKSEAINFVIDKYEEHLLEPELKPEFIKEMKNIEKKGQFKTYKSLSALKSDIKNA